MEIKVPIVNAFVGLDHRFVHPLKSHKGCGVYSRCALATGSHIQNLLSPEGTL